MFTYRHEEDLIGCMNIPTNIYWGIHTERAKRNFDFGFAKVNMAIIFALAMVKKACTITNYELGFLEEKKAKAIITACDEIMEGKFSDQFPLDALQGGAGTSINMNLNEVIANRAIETLGGLKGNYNLVHPLHDVNLHQSTNDVFPTAIKIAAIFKLRELSEAIARLQGAFQKKEKEFAGIVKIGRTELQEAVPLTLGTEFAAFAEAIARDRWRTFKCEERLRVVNLGGTAIGTGLTAPKEYIFLVIEKLREITGLGLCRGENVPGETANADPFVEVSGILKAHASNLVKINNDLRLLNLFGEIMLPALQSGSSIMPGKINPVLCEAAIQIGLKVMANDFLITEATSRSTLQICEFLPILAHALLESLDLLIILNQKVVAYINNINANEEKCQEYFNKSLTLITAFLPLIGYKQAEALVKEFLNLKGVDLKEFLSQRLGENVVKDILSPYKLTALGYRQ
ncbi:Aspartate ammonia-lyase [Thermodesulfobium narugense DSM 14796]|uniref:Aspartate ammonia-lyase n=1 Tax=Thermodesulfobium narugense DSM 14796 TaxID=747365 RepID=M1E8E1_9BACT|nr:aspartate ammonia-lyase [Thermodesulfobium narugense]AEE15123.1 Aspartate ammonia-lyase [Thermodesulfobium narugense DSM 14796]